MTKKLTFGLLFSISCFAAGPWAGKISDSSCGVSHAKMAGQHGKSDRECALACIRNGSKYVFVSAGSVYQISNQDFADLEKRAGQMVELTGDMKGDAVTVTKISKR